MRKGERAKPPSDGISLKEPGWNSHVFFAYISLGRIVLLKLSGGKCKYTKENYLDFNIFYKLACLTQASLCILYVKCVMHNDSCNSLGSFVATGSRSLLLTLVAFALQN